MIHIVGEVQFRGVLSDEVQNLLQGQDYRIYVPVDDTPYPLYLKRFNGNIHYEVKVEPGHWLVKWSDNDVTVEPRRGAREPYRPELA